MRVAQKNRNPSKRKTQRKGLSGNPQRRAEQLAAEPSVRQSDLDRLSAADTESLTDLVRRLGGGGGGGAKQEP
jgi:hypothetical protein